MARIMAIVNLTPDSFFEESRSGASDAIARIRNLFDEGADIVDLGAVSSRPGASEVSLEEEWSRLESVLLDLADGAVPGLGYGHFASALSIDTTRSEIVRRAFGIIGPFIVNDISAGEDDPEMLAAAGSLGLGYIAMHKRGGPSEMDSLCSYPEGVIPELLKYFEGFSLRAADAGLSRWALDPGLGFAKTAEQNWEILMHLDELLTLGRPILIGAADKRFTRQTPPEVSAACGGLEGTLAANCLALMHGASILRVHSVRQIPVI